MARAAGLFVRWCATCSRVWAVADKGGCPSCGEDGECLDAYRLIEQLASVRLEEDAEADQGMREFERA